MPAFPTGASQLSAYHFSQLATGSVTPAALGNYDTVILYRIRWSDLSAGAHAAIDTFAATHKVMIWDADDTGSQGYVTFVHPFAETSSGENYKGKPNASVVSYPTEDNFLASDNPSSPYYFDPNQLITDRDEIADMNAMTTGTTNWLPALIAANAKIPNGGWPLAWSYGVIGNQTGLTIYSGIDVDAFGNLQLNPNYAIKELALQLQAPFRATANPACAPNCTLGGTPSPPPPPHASCSFAKPTPKHWVHGRTPIWLKTSVAAGITGEIVTGSGQVMASGREHSGGLVGLRVQTRRLPSNHASRLRAVVLVGGQQAYSMVFRLKVDNTKPRLLLLHTWRASGGDELELRVSERSSMAIVGAHVGHQRPKLIAARRTIRRLLPGTVKTARLILRDRAGNTVVRKLVW